MTFRETELVLFTADLAGYARASAQLRPLDIAAALVAWYGTVDAAIARSGGGVVKYMGDGCLATFPPEGSVAAVEAAMRLLGQPPTGLEVRVGVRIHFGVVAEGEVGAQRRYDIFGSAVNHLFRMGGAGSVLISEPVYQRLPAADRGPWQRHPVLPTYALVQ